MKHNSQLEQILSAVQSGQLTIREAMMSLRELPYEDLEYAKIDHHRPLRTGFPEVVFCQGKTIEQVVEILGRLSARHPSVLATRVTPDMAHAVAQAIPHSRYHDSARCITVCREEISDNQDDSGRYVLIVSAGTADIPIAEEAAVTAETMGSRVERVYDVGVAGLHRLLDQKSKLEGANVIIVCAGMEGALPSVVGGLVDCPVIAVPTSIGYGASFQGLAALLSMLNTCAEGVAVVNIDNGFGAGYFAHLINR